MFPRLDREEVVQGAEAVYEAVLQALRKVGPRGRGKRIGSKGPIFAVHNKNKKMDKIGIGYSEDYTNITWDDIQTYIRYDVFDNDFFVVGNRLLRQKKGIAIGGIISAQLAELFCMAKELKFLSQTVKAQKQQQAKFLPPHSLILNPYRFRDNIVGVLRGKIGLARVQRWFEHIYGLDLQVEGEGVVLPSLEATLSLHEGKVGLRLKTKVNLLDNSERRIVRFPDRHSVNAKEAVKSIVIGLGIKCVWYSMSEEDIRANITSTIRELEVKNYPKSWWRGHLFMAVERSGHLLGAQVACLLRDHTNPR